MITGLKWVGSLKKYEFIYTERPLEEIWHLIDFFTAQETIAECNPPVDNELIPLLCESIIQAEEFRNSAETSGEHTKPLLIYYCIHNLTKAMLVMETNKNPAGYHGLMKVEVPASGDLLDVSVQVNEGVFWELLEFNKITPKKNFRLTINDLIRRCGYLSREYNFAYKKTSDVLIPKLEADLQLTTLELTIKKTTHDFEAKWKELFPSLSKYFELLEIKDDFATLKLKTNNPPKNITNIHKILDDTLVYSVFQTPPYFLTPLTNTDLFWTQDAILYALSFILGALVRYYPDYWHQQIIGNKRNRWVIRKITSIVERVYPNLMINIMFNYKSYRFGTTHW